MYDAASKILVEDFEINNLNALKLCVYVFECCLLESVEEY